MAATLNQHIEVAPEVRDGKPRIAGTHMTVGEIAIGFGVCSLHWEGTRKGDCETWLRYLKLQKKFIDLPISLSKDRGLNNIRNSTCRGEAFGS
jgi:hypothetical protein